MFGQYFKDLALSVFVLVLMIAVVACGKSADTELTLLRRLLTLETPSASFLGEPEILPGELPSDLSVDIPIVEGAKLIGSMVCPLTYPGEYEYYRRVEVILDVSGQPEEVLTLYSEALTEAGWSQAESSSPDSPYGGFEPEWAMFCHHEKEGPFLMIRVSPMQEKGLTDVHLYLFEIPGCPLWPEIDRFLPMLEAPEGAGHEGLGGIGHEGYYSSHAILETDLSLQELQGHYQQQLLEAEWDLEEQGGNRTVSWSTWSFTDDWDNGWTGLLMVRKLGEGNWRMVHLEANLKL